jgi:hypothetical protein
MEGLLLLKDGWLLLIEHWLLLEGWLLLESQLLLARRLLQLEWWLLLEGCRLLLGKLRLGVDWVRSPSRLTQSAGQQQVVGAHCFLAVPAGGGNLLEVQARPVDKGMCKKKTRVSTLYCEKY